MAVDAAGGGVAAAAAEAGASSAASVAGVQEANVQSLTLADGSTLVGDLRELWAGMEEDEDGGGESRQPLARPPRPEVPELSAEDLQWCASQGRRLVERAVPACMGRAESR